MLEKKAKHHIGYMIEKQKKKNMINTGKSFECRIDIFDNIW